MNRLFQTLRGRANKNTQRQTNDTRHATPDALPGFDRRVEVLVGYAQQAAAYEDDLTTAFARVEADLIQLEEAMERSIDLGRDRDALEYVRLAARLRPQRELITFELRAFQAVSNALILRVQTLLDHLDEARQYAHTNSLSPAATQLLDSAMTKLTRYFVMLERVSTARRQSLGERLAAQMTTVIDDRQLDLELATYILRRRRTLTNGE